ncbi:MAG: CsbD family protein [Rhodoplanes sp.]
MDKDRIVGSAKQIKGAVKQVVGKAAGDAKLESEGMADKVEGEAQNAIGSLKRRSKGNSRRARALRSWRSWIPCGPAKWQA